MKTFLAVKNGKGYQGKSIFDIVDQLATFTVTICDKCLNNSLENNLTAIPSIEISAIIEDFVPSFRVYSLEKYSVEEALRHFKLDFWSRLEYYGYITNSETNV